MGINKDVFEHSFGEFLKIMWIQYTGNMDTFINLETYIRTELMHALFDTKVYIETSFLL